MLAKRSRTALAMLNIQTNCISSITPFCCSAEDGWAESRTVHCGNVNSWALGLVTLNTLVLCSIPLFFQVLWPSLWGKDTWQHNFISAMGQKKCSQRRPSYPGTVMQSTRGNREGKTNPGPYSGRLWLYKVCRGNTCIDQIGICCAAEWGHQTQADELYHAIFQVIVPVRNATEILFASDVNLQNV